mgnify:CR=1 FL=1
MKKAISCFIRISKIKLLCVSPERKTHRRTYKTGFTVEGGRLENLNFQMVGNPPSSLSTSLLSFKSFLLP